MSHFIATHRLRWFHPSRGNTVLQQWWADIEGFAKKDATIERVIAECAGEWREIPEFNPPHQDRPA